MSFYKSSKILLILLSIFASAAMAYTPQLVGENANFRLHWKTPIIRVALSNSLNAQNTNVKSNSDVAGAVQRSLETWEKAANIKFQTIWTDKQSLSSSGSAGDGVSLITIAQTPENLLFFASDSNEVSARTRAFYNRKGFITEADIVLNPYQQFSTDGSIGTFDLEATLTHEIGHLLGLEHSFILGSTMNERQGKNGVFNLPGFASRTLSDADLSAVRALYGAKTGDEGCCGVVNGKLSLASGKPAREFQIWAEETETGRVVSGALTNSDGTFRLEGLPNGEYRIFSQKIGEKTENSFAVENLGVVDVQNAKQIDFFKKIQSKPEAFNLQYLGLNGQISGLAVPLSAGKSHVVYLAGKSFDPDEVDVSFNTPYVSAVPGTFIKHDYGSEISVISFEVKIDGRAAAGEYGIYVKNRSGKLECLPGGLIIEASENLSNPSILVSNQ